MIEQAGGEISFKSQIKKFTERLNLYRLVPCQTYYFINNQQDNISPPQIEHHTHDLKFIIDFT